MGETGQIKRKLKRDFEESMDIDDSDIPVHEKFVKGDNIIKLRKK